jgi:hypothetical protein
VTTDEVLLGVGLIVALAVGAARLEGARICVQPADGTASADDNLLFLVRADGRLAPATRSGPPEPEPGDSMVVLTARPAGCRLVIRRG